MHINNDLYIWSAEDQLLYIKQCQSLRNKQVFWNPEELSHFIQKIYINGFESGVLQLSFDEFKTALLTNDSIWSNQYNYNKETKDSPFYSIHRVDFRQGLKYVKRNHHNKKNLSRREEAKRNWRKEKGIDLDKQKAGGRHDGCPPWMKRMCNKTHRAWERDCITSEQYDELGGWTWKRKDLFDPWMWD